MTEMILSNMKSTIRTILFAAVAILTTIACQNSDETAEHIDDNKGTIDLQIIGLMGEYSQNDVTRASLVNTVRASWEGGETVYVYDGTQLLGSLKATLQGDDDRYAILSTDATHTVKTPAQGTTKLTLVYSPLLAEAPAVSDNAISISLADQNSAKAPFVVFATLDYKATTITNAVVPFQFATSVIKANCTGLKANTAITRASLKNVNTSCKLTLSGTEAPTVTGDANGTIVRTADSYFAADNVNAEGEAMFQIAVPKLDQTSQRRTLTIIQDHDSYCHYDVNFTKSSLNPALSVNTVCQLESDALSGVFTVNAENKTVHFSKGNLRYTVATQTWSFFDKQSDCGPSTYAAGHDKEISLFTWGYNPEQSIIPDGRHENNVNITSGNLSQEQDWGCTMGDGTTWRTLTHDEWLYLFKTREMKNGGPRYTLNIRCGGILGIVIYPDDYNGSALSGTIAEIPEGVVFLPAAGNRVSGQVKYFNDYADYWSSTGFLKPDLWDPKTIFLEAFYISFWSQDPTSKYDWNTRSFHGYSVRLVAEIE